VLRLSVFLVAALSLGCAANMPRDWKRVYAAGPFAVDVPVDAQHLSQDGIDVDWHQYVTRDLTISCGYGWHVGCNPKGAERTTVSGQPGSISVTKLAHPDAMKYEGELCVRLKMNTLNVSVRGKSEDVVLRVLRSVGIP